MLCCISCFLLLVILLSFFVLQWNNHGYDVAKIFGHKLSYVSPVWLQLKRSGVSTYVIEGKHDVDKGTSCERVVTRGVHLTSHVKKRGIGA